MGMQSQMFLGSVARGQRDMERRTIEHRSCLDMVITNNGSSLVGGWINC